MKELINELYILTSKALQDAKQIQKLTKEMTGYIDREEVDSLKQAIALRQRWIQQAEGTKEKIEKNISAIKAQYTIEHIENIKQWDPWKGSTILTNRMKIQDTYESTYELEKQNQKKAEKLLEGYKDQIKGIHLGKKAHQAYGKQAMGPVILNKVK